MFRGNLDSIYWGEKFFCQKEKRLDRGTAEALPVCVNRESFLPTEGRREDCSCKGKANDLPSSGGRSA